MSTVSREQLEADVTELQETLRNLEARVRALELDRSYREGWESGLSRGQRAAAGMGESLAGAAGR